MADPKGQGNIIIRQMAHGIYDFNNNSLLTRRVPADNIIKSIIGGEKIIDIPLEIYNS